MTSLLVAKLGRQPDDLELAEALGFAVERYRRLMARSISAQILSLEAMTDRGWDIAS